ncbi:hypothetical protein Bca4012_062292 [Brassica carinata]
MEGVLYCKPHFEQLFKETGSFNKNFQSLAKPLTDKPTPELTMTSSNPLPSNAPPLPPQLLLL